MPAALPSQPNHRPVRQMRRNRRMPHRVHHAAFRRRALSHRAARLRNDFLFWLFMRLSVLPELPDFATASRPAIHDGTADRRNAGFDRERRPQSQFRDARALVAPHPAALRSHPQRPSGSAVRLEQLRLLPRRNAPRTDKNNRYFPAGFQIRRRDTFTTVHPYDGLSVRRAGCHPLSCRCRWLSASF